jgi:leucyl aminopeptidase
MRREKSRIWFKYKISLRVGTNLMLWTQWPLKWTTTFSRSRGSDQSAELIIRMTDKVSIEDNRQLLHPELDEALREMVKRGTYHGISGDTAILPTLGLVPGKYVLFVGCDSAPCSSKSLREAAGSLGAKLLEYKIKKAVFVVPAG